MPMYDILGSVQRTCALAYDVSATVIVGFGVLFMLVVGLPLLITLFVEVAVAAGFRVGRDLLVSVGLVNGVTNPIANLVLFYLYGFGVGFRVVGSGGRTGDVPIYVPTHLWYALLVPILLASIVVEWRLLAWAAGKRIPSMRLLMLSVTMNVASIVLGSWVLLSRLFY
jgi:hypothetical protein